MKSQLYSVVWILCIIILTIPSAFSQPSPSSNKENWFKEHTDRKNRKNLSGWKGVVFICSKEEVPEKNIDDVCRKANEDAAFLAAASRVRIFLAKNYEEFFRHVRINNFLPLTADFTFTKTGSPSAVYVHLKSSVSYDEAIEYKEARKVSDNQSYSPRAGDLIIWERSLIGASSGTSDALVTPISQGVEQMLKVFFTDYLNANN